jgi:radial spoke head protein 1
MEDSSKEGYGKLVSQQGVIYIGQF